jgi:hypothetical protein
MPELNLVPSSKNLTQRDVTCATREQYKTRPELKVYGHVVSARKWEDGLGSVSQVLD